LTRNTSKPHWARASGDTHRIQRIRGGQINSVQHQGERQLEAAAPALPRRCRASRLAASDERGSQRARLLLVLLIIAIAAGPAVPHWDRQSRESSLPGFVWATVLLSGLLKFDFAETSIIR